MQENNDKNQGKNGLSFESLDILIAKWKDGTFSEIIDDWKWIFSYSVRYKWAIVFYTILGIFSTSMGLVSSVAGKYLIDIITGYKTNKLMILIIVMVGSSLFSLLFSSIISRISTKLSIYINFKTLILPEWAIMRSFCCISSCKEKIPEILSSQKYFAGDAGLLGR